MVDTHLEYRRLVESGHAPVEAEAIIEGLRGVSGENLSIIKEIRKESSDLAQRFSLIEQKMSFIQYIGISIVTLLIGVGISLIRAKI